MLLSLKNITKGFGDPDDPSHRKVLEELSMDVEQGESIAILGPSGSGKTTLLNIIGGMDYPDRGSVQFNGQEITSLSSGEMDHFRNKQIGFVFQFHHLLPQCTLMENVLVPTLTDTADRKANSSHAEALMKRVGIWEYRDKLPAKLSGGECQRAAVVRAMINSPSLLLADEPTGALDRDNVGAMASLLLDLNREDGLTLIVVTHSADLAGRMGKTMELLNGKLQKI